MSSWIAPALVTALVLFMLYRRYKRTFGPQRIKPVMLVLRGLLLLGIAIVLLPSAFATSMWSVAGIVLGTAAGAALGVYSLSKATYHTTPEGKFYVPDPYVGITITAVFL